MPDSTPEVSGGGIEETKVSDKPESPNDSPLGVYAPFPYSPEPFAELSDKARLTLLALDDIATKTDVAARRMEIEQAWEALHFERGYQHLFRGKRGGWELPGGGQGKKANEKNHNSIYDTNVYGPKGDIIVAALSREVPKIEFFPANPEWGPDKIAAEEADRFKDIWDRNNNLHDLLVQCARIFWNEDRALMWTRYELNGQKYGFEEDQGTPTVPEDMLNPPDNSPTGQEGQEDFLQVTESESEGGEELGGEGSEAVDALLSESGVGNGSKKPLGREVTTVHGKLDHKVPISVDNFSEMQFVQLMLDYDVAMVRGMFPWIASKVRPGSDGQSATQLDRIARENVRQAVLGAYVTGDSLSRHTTVKYTWMRPSFFLDESVGDEVKAELLEAFPDGVLLARAGQEYAFSRNEKMDDHLVIGHPTAGKGQNRRAMGTALISIQKRINDWVDLLDDFFKRTIPKKWMNAEAFDMDAIKTEPNVPGSIGPFEPQPGLTTESQYIMVEPTPQHQPALPDFIKWFITTLSEEISGALPSLFGNNTGENTVGNSVIQRDQALQRVGCPWNNIQDMFAVSAQQAVKCAAECRDGKEITQNLGPERGNVTVNTANLLGGNVLCYPESNPSIPETEEQKAVKIMSMVDKAIAAPATPFAQWVFSPSNLAETAQALRMKNYKVVGASSVTKQRCEFEMLLRNVPMPNPKLLQMQSGLEKAQNGMQASQIVGEPIPPQAPMMIQQLQQAIQALPKLVSSIPVAEDESENHIVEANECFEWMNSTEGQKFKFGSEKQKAGYENVHLHWTEHVAMAKKIMAANKPPEKPPSESISVDVSKMPASVAAQALAKMGIQATPDVFAQHADQELNHKVAAKAIPHALEHAKETPQVAPQGQ
jgi:hypothetical protein